MGEAAGLPRERDVAGLEADGLEQRREQGDFVVAITGAELEGFLRDRHRLDVEDVAHVADAIADELKERGELGAERFRR